MERHCGLLMTRAQWKAARQALHLASRRGRWTMRAVRERGRRMVEIVIHAPAPRITGNGDGILTGAVRIAPDGAVSE